MWGHITFIGGFIMAKAIVRDQASALRTLVRSTKIWSRLFAVAKRDIKENAQAELMAASLIGCADKASAILALRDEALADETDALLTQLGLPAQD
jgi:hypothetical protein